MTEATTTSLSRRRWLARSAAAGVAAAPGLLPALARAAGPAWPSQALRIVVPFAAGGTSDVISRLISKPLSDLLGQPVVVENKTGASGNVGAGAVANATDGHTMLLSDLGALAVSPLVSKDMPFKPEQLKGVTMLAYSPHLLVVHPSVPASNVKELAALSQKQRLNAASSGSGTPNHLGIVDIALGTGMKWQHVPYRGGAAAINDTVAGNTQMLLNGMVATYPLVQAGKLKIIGVSKRTRMAVIGNVPTLAEQGVPNFESGTYQGVVVPSTMSAPHVDKLNAALIQVIRESSIRARLVELGAEVMTSSPQETTQWLVKERARWASVIQRAGKELEGTA
ncbi:MAG TPA: tripartite tricarboxylate transporter substrate binding protein [Burkholderiaceae bacterium]|nr:tripartite tricarboxylate transporter substrate binding protein [Burkholderiaceae bacterium]